MKLSSDKKNVPSVCSNERQTPLLLSGETQLRTSKPRGELGSAHLSLLVCSTLNGMLSASADLTASLEGTNLSAGGTSVFPSHGDVSTGPEPLYPCVLGGQAAVWGILHIYARVG